MRVLGKDRFAESYRVAVDLDGTQVVGRVPDALLSAQYGTDARVSHTAAYEWIEAKAADLQTAIATLHRGGTPRAPFDQITLDAP